MQEQSLQQAVVQTAAILDRFQQETERLVAQHQHARQALAESAKTTQRTLDNWLNQSGHIIADQARKAVHQGLEQELEGARKALSQAAEALSQSTRQWTVEHQQTTRFARATSWKAMVFSLVALALLLVGMATTLFLAQQRLDEIQVKAEVMTALQKVEIASCGGQACIKLDKQAARWGNGQYVLLATGEAP